MSIPGASARRLLCDLPKRMPAAVSDRFIPSRRQVAPPRPLESVMADFLAFLIPAASSFTISFGGELPYGEILTLLLLPVVLVLRQKRIFQSRYRTIYLLMLLSLSSQVFTDMYMNVGLLNRAKGIARIVFFAIDLAVVSAIVANRRRRINLFALGLAVMYGISYFHSRSRNADLTMSVSWKLFLFQACGIVLFLFASRFYARKKYWPLWGAIAILTLMSVVNGSRSATLFALAAAAPILTRYLSNRGDPYASRGNNLVKLFALALLALSAAWVAHKAIKWGVHAGIYSEGEGEKFKNQSRGKYGSLVGGRPEWPVAIQAILDSPILGHGSYATDPKYLLLLQDYQYKWGYSDSDVATELENPGIPTHSHLTGAWVEGGVLASFLWFYVLWLCARSVFCLTEVFHPLAPLYIFLFITFFWDILFSPFGETRRMQEAFFLVLMLYLPGVAGKNLGRWTRRPRFQPVYRRRIVRLTSPDRSGRRWSPRIS